jgi:hypothetical protein
MPGPYVLLWQNDNLLEVKGLEVKRTGAAIDSATIQVTVKEDGTPVSGQSWPLTLNAVGSGGDYYGTLDDAISVDPGDRLTAEVDAVDTAGRAFWELPVAVKIRRE